MTPTFCRRQRRGDPDRLTPPYLGRDSSNANYLDGTVHTTQFKASRTDRQLEAAVTDYAGFPLET